MNEKNKISVVINTYNAEKNLKQVIESIKGFDEILVCDMESTDHTREIAKQMGCRIVTFPKANYVSAEPARTFAIQSAAFSWVLVVDADELVTPELHDYLYDFISKPDETAGLYIPRINHFMGQPLTCSYPDYQLRFFIREGTEWPPFVHTFPKVNGRLAYLPRSRREMAFIHLDENISSFLEKSNRYSYNEAQRKAYKKWGVGALIYRPVWRFFRAYVIEGGWHDGVRGLIYAGLRGIYHFEVVAKMIEMRKKNSRK